MMPVSPADPGATLSGRFRGFQDLAAAPHREHPARQQPLRLVHPGRGRSARRADPQRVPRPELPAQSRHHARLVGRRGAGAGDRPEPVQPDHHVDARRGHGRARARAPRQGRRPRHPGRAAGLRRARALAVPRAPRHLRPRARLSLAGRRHHPPRHREGDRGPAERRARHGADGRAGRDRHRGQRPLLLVVPAGDLLGADAPLASSSRRRA